MIDKIAMYFCQKGYMRVSVPEKEMQIVFRITSEGLYYLCLIDDTRGFLKNKAMVSGILLNIRQALSQKYEKYCSKCEGLAVILTNDPRQTKEFLNDADNFWLLHVPTKKLMVFDNQPWDFYDARPIIEEQLKQTPFTVVKQQLSELFSPVNIGLITVNVLIFILMEIFGSTEDISFMHQYGAISVYDVVYEKQYWRLITCAFLHFGFWHLFTNMLVLLYMGKPLEMVLGSVKYAVFYLICAVSSSGLSILCYYHWGKWFVLSAGASGAVYGVIGGLAYVLFRNRKENGRNVLLRFFGLFALLLASSFGDGTENINVSAHVSGLAVGLLLSVLMYRKPKHKRN